MKVTDVYRTGHRAPLSCFSSQKSPETRSQSQKSVPESQCSMWLAISYIHKPGRLVQYLYFPHEIAFVGFKWFACLNNLAEFLFLFLTCVVFPRGKMGLVDSSWTQGFWASSSFTARTKWYENTNCGLVKKVVSQLHLSVHFMSISGGPRPKIYIKITHCDSLYLSYLKNCPPSAVPEFTNSLKGMNLLCSSHWKVPGF